MRCLVLLLALIATPALPASRYAQMEIVSTYVEEECDPGADIAAARILRRTQSRQTWSTQLRIDAVSSRAWPAIQRSFASSGMDFHDVVWASNERQPRPNAIRADGGQPTAVFPVKYLREEATWTLLDINRRHPDRPPSYQLVKTGELSLGGEAEYRASFFIEMMRSTPTSATDEPEPVPLVPGAPPELEATALLPHVYNLSAAVSGFLVRSTISGRARQMDPELETWSETPLAAPKSSEPIPGFERRTRPRSGRDGIVERQLRKRGLAAALVRQLIEQPGQTLAPLELTAKHVERQYASEAADAAVLRERHTTTTVKIRFESQDLPDPVPLSEDLPEAAPLS